MNILKNIRISKDNKLKPLKGNTVRVYRSVNPISIEKLQQLGATVILVNNPPVESMVDAVLRDARFSQGESQTLKKGT